MKFIHPILLHRLTEKDVERYFDYYRDRNGPIILDNYPGMWFLMDSPELRMARSILFGQRETRFEIDPVPAYFHCCLQ